VHAQNIDKRQFQHQFFLPRYFGQVHVGGLLIDGLVVTGDEVDTLLGIDVEFIDMGQVHDMVLVK
jgi:hypothetical protein